MEQTPIGNVGFVDLQAIKALGKKVDKQARQANYDEEAFCEITSDALDSFEAEIRFDPIAIGRFLSSTTVPQKAFPFSNLSVTLFKNPNFYIEVLCWFTASTAIHAHGFCGAFKVAVGSSLHSVYNFTPDSRLSEKVIIGSLNCLYSESLTRDSVRVIKGGNDGLVHSLFHIEKPSLSLVIRSHSSKAFQPQYVFHPPGLALDSFALDKDPEAKLISKLISVCEIHEPDSLQQLLESSVLQLDFARLSWIVLANSALVQSKLEQDRFWNCVHQRHGKNGYILREACYRSNSNQRLQSLRNLTDDQDMRYFLACLLNAPNRRILTKMITDGRPDRDPVEFIATSICRLSKLAPNPQRLLDDMSNWKNHYRYKIPSQLAPIFSDPNSSIDEFETWLRCAIRNGGDDANPQSGAEGKSRFSRLSEIPELAPIWTSD